MKKWVKILIGILAALVVTITVTIMVLDEPRPSGKEGEEAEEMADKIFNAVGKSAWDSLTVISWTFRGENQYVWHRGLNKVEVKWGGNRTILDLDNGTARAWRDATELGGGDAETVIRKSWHYFYNDSFWLQAFNKLRDEGTKREVVECEDGRKGLLVTYSSGGITPGDAYLWFFDANGLPTSYKIWVKIIPIGGLEFSWEGWQTLPGGARVAVDHKNGPMNVATSNIQAGFSLTEIGLSEDYFNVP